MPEVFSAPTKNKSNPHFISRMFATFIEKPNDIRFQDQHDGEKIILVVRRHWITNIPWLLISFLLILTPFIVIPFLSLPAGFILALVTFWYLGIFGYILLNFLFWFYNVGIITDERIIDVDFVYLLYSEITQTVISKIEDVTDKRGGFLSVFFDYGSVFVQTAGELPNIEFLVIPKPAFVVEVITQLLEQK